MTGRAVTGQAVTRRDISQRWVLSFADLALLLLAFFVMMQAQMADRVKLAASLRGAFGGQGAGGSGGGVKVEGFAAGQIFEAGEAILKPGVQAKLKAIGAEAARGGRRVIVASQGRDGQSARLDAWELSAARTTAVARAIRMGGVPDAMIEISIPPMRASEPAKGQRIAVQTVSGKAQANP
ncbi:flagellar motor protein MotB [Rhizorhabdus dicambivorans]|uniref:flagellar motor protein MotB n=1 Tax=Rhizorhabdus dicambivorans TaxID=1850238 RepID=UPI001EDF0FE4|nr:flagellar motor protein MotB [Rhizorhabdus dicambivorans]